MFWDALSGAFLSNINWTRSDVLRDEAHENVCLVIRLSIPMKTVDLYFHTGGSSPNEAKMWLPSLVIAWFPHNRQQLLKDES